MAVSQCTAHLRLEAVEKHGWQLDTIQILQKLLMAEGAQVRRPLGRHWILHAPQLPDVRSRRCAMSADASAVCGYLPGL